MTLSGITDLYGQRTAGYTSAGALETRRGLPGYGPQDNPYGQVDHGRWGEAASPVWAAPGWNATLERDAQDAYVGGFVLTDDTDYEGQGEGSVNEQLDRTPFAQTETSHGTWYSGRGRSTGGYHPEFTGHTAPPDGYSTHAAPFPRTWTQAGRTRPEPGTQLDDQWTEQESRRITHEGGYGADKPANRAGEPPVFGRRDFYYQTQGETLLDPDMSEQVRFAGDGPAMGNTARQHGPNSDHVQGGGHDNAYGYGQAHVMNYRQQTDGVPFNYNWLDASERPFIPKGQATNMWAAQTLDGPDSPYGAMGDQTDYHAAVWAPAMVEGPATPYAAPPDPTLNTTGYADSGDDVFAEW